MPSENPGAYDEARKRIRENKEREETLKEESQEAFERGKEKLYAEKKFDIFELKRRIDTGHSLESLKSDIREALNSGQITIDNYTNSLELIESTDKDRRKESKILDTVIDPIDFPLSQSELTRYFESKRIGENPLIDLAGFAYGVAQGSVFLLYMLGRMLIDTILLPKDLYTLFKK